MTKKVLKDLKKKKMKRKMKSDIKVDGSGRMKIKSYQHNIKF